MSSNDPTVFADNQPLAVDGTYGSPDTMESNEPFNSSSSHPLNTNKNVAAEDTPASPTTTSIAIEKDREAEETKWKKSLFFCLVLENPFFLTDGERDKIKEAATGKKSIFDGKVLSSVFCRNNNRKTDGGEADVDNANDDDDSSDEEEMKRNAKGLFQGYTRTLDSGEVVEETLLRDEDLLRNPEKGANKFQRVIDIVRRLEVKGFDVLPSNMIIAVDSEEAQEKESPVGVDNHGEEDYIVDHFKKANNFKGWMINRSALILSPDNDELYIKIHGQNRHMLRYAEQSYMKLRTKSLSAGGGQMMTYSEKLELELCLSMVRNAFQFKEDLKTEQAIAEKGDKYIANEIKEINAFVADLTKKGEKSMKEEKEKEKSTSSARKEANGDHTNDHDHGRRGSDFRSRDENHRVGSAKESAELKAALDAVTKAGANGDLAGKGFDLDVPNKMRIVSTMVREPWEYGGCGLQINEMKRKGILVKHFFPLHNTTYQESYGLDYWGSIGALLPWSKRHYRVDDDDEEEEQENKGQTDAASPVGVGVNEKKKTKEYKYRPIHQSSQKINQYFGESIALYFLWLHEYTLFLPWIAIPGVILTVLPWISDSISRAITHGVFAILCVIWGVLWLGRWSRRERKFCAQFQQQQMVMGEGARDEFRFDAKRPLTMFDLYHLQFEVPATFKRNSDGSYVDLYYPDLRRTLVRYFISLPLTIILAGGMVVILTVLTWWRFREVGNDLVSYACSILGVITSVTFGTVFGKVVQITNWLENPRTYTEEEHITVMKNFCFSFFSFYYAMFVIALYPTDATMVERLKELEVQMIIVCVVKPAVQNAQELILPWVMTQLRLRVDSYDGYCGAICSFFCCRPACNPEKDELKVGEDARLKEEGMRLWKEAQLEPYVSTSDDYLEISLQYGYMCMFAATFPWAPLAAFVYNAIEIKIDANKLLRFCQRPIARPASDIGSWNLIMTALAGFSMITNAYLICVMSPAARNAGIHDSIQAKWLSFIILQYIFIVASVFIYGWAAKAHDFELRVQTKHTILQMEGARENADARKEREERMRAMRERRKAREQYPELNNHTGNTPVDGTVVVAAEGTHQRRPFRHGDGEGGRRGGRGDGGEEGGHRGGGGRRTNTLPPTEAVDTAKASSPSPAPHEEEEQPPMQHEEEGAHVGGLSEGRPANSQSGRYDSGV